MSTAPSILAWAISFATITAIITGGCSILNTGRSNGTKPDVGKDIGTDQSCIPDCADRACGDDGCGGTCGECREDQTCNQYMGM